MKKRATPKRASNFHGKKGRSGAPRGNRNALRHGLKSGELPKDCKYVEIRINVIRRNIEDAVIACKGKVSLTDAAYINTAIKWERYSILSHRWLTREYKKLPITERLKITKEIATSSEKRDAALEALYLDEDKAADIFDAIAKAMPKVKAHTNE